MPRLGALTVARRPLGRSTLTQLIQALEIELIGLRSASNPVPPPPPPPKPYQTEEELSNKFLELERGAWVAGGRTDEGDGRWRRLVAQLPLTSRSRALSDGTAPADDHAAAAQEIWRRS